MKRVLLALVFSVLAGPLAAAQTIRSALTGTATDSTGALVPGASVRHGRLRGKLSSVFDCCSNHGTRADRPQSHSVISTNPC